MENEKNNSLKEEKTTSQEILLFKGEINFKENEHGNLIIETKVYYKHPRWPIIPLSELET